MKKAISSLLFFFVYFLVFVKSSFAADVEVSCTSGSCTQSPSGAIFDSTNIYPGWSITKVVKGVNNYSQDATFATSLSNLINTQDPGSTGNLSDVLIISFRKTGSITTIYEDTLTNFKNYGYLKLSDISAGGNQDYDVTITMQTSAGNEYQAVKTTFDLILGFELLPIPSSPPVSPSASPGVGGCSATAPGSVANLSASMISSSVVLLNWSAASGAITHYGVSYGLSPGVYLYGATNIGNVTSYSVSNLSSGTTYYFVVYAYNDCASSSASNEVSTATGGVLGAFVAIGPAPGFQVLGATASFEPVVELSLPQVQGESIACKKYLWWLPLVFQALLTWLYYLRARKKNKKYWWLLPAILAIISQIIHEILGCKCIFSKWCSKYWLFNLIIIIGYSGYYLWKKRTKTSSH